MLQFRFGYNRLFSLLLSEVTYRCHVIPDQIPMEQKQKKRECKQCSCQEQSEPIKLQNVDELALLHDHDFESEAKVEKKGGAGAD